MRRRSDRRRDACLSAVCHILLSNELVIDSVNGFSAVVVSNANHDVHLCGALVDDPSADVYFCKRPKKSSCHTSSVAHCSAHG